MVRKAFGLAALAAAMTWAAAGPGTRAADDKAPPGIWPEYVAFDKATDETYGGYFWNPTKTVCSQTLRVRAQIQGWPNTVYGVRFSAAADSEGPFTTLTTVTADATNEIGSRYCAMTAYSWENYEGCISNLPLCSYGWWVQIELIRGGVVRDTKQYWVEPVDDTP